MVYNWSYFDLLLPACLICGLASTQRICTACRGDLPVTATGCSSCGLPLPAGLQTPDGQVAPACGSASAGLCPACRAGTPPITRLVTAFNYAFPVDVLIRQLKFDGCLPVAGALGDMLGARVCAAYATRDACGDGRGAPAASDSLPQAIVPVPLHPRRLRERGYNQAERIARPVSKALQIPLRADAIARQRHTDAQSGMDLTARQQNLRDAFAVRAPLPAHVAIVDDVMTSGSTLHAVAATLAAAGVARIDAWVVARTL